MGKHVSQRGYSITGNVIYVDISRINGLIALVIAILFLRAAVRFLKDYTDRKKGIGLAESIAKLQK